MSAFSSFASGYNQRLAGFHRRTTYILDKSSTIAVTCVGDPTDLSSGPSNQKWRQGMARLAIFLEKTRDKYEAKLTGDDRKNRRGYFTAVNVGITRGSGAKVSCVS